MFGFGNENKIVCLERKKNSRPPPSDIQWSAPNSKMGILIVGSRANIGLWSNSEQQEDRVYSLQELGRDAKGSLA